MCAGSGLDLPHFSLGPRGVSGFASAARRVECAFPLPSAWRVQCIARVIANGVYATGGGPRMLPGRQALFLAPSESGASVLGTPGCFVSNRGRHLGRKWPWIKIRERQSPRSPLCQSRSPMQMVPSTHQQALQAESTWTRCCNTWPFELSVRMTRTCVTGTEFEK